MNPFRTDDTYTAQWIVSSLFQVLVCHQFRTKPLPKPMRVLETGPLKHWWNLNKKHNYQEYLISRKCIFKMAATVSWAQSVKNSLWPSKAIWQHTCISVFTLAQVMACSLVAPSLYLNQFRLLGLRELLWHSYESNFTSSALGARL